jgi:hypothetical protein
VGGIGEKVPRTFSGQCSVGGNGWGAATYLVHSTSKDVDCGVCVLAMTSLVSSCLWTSSLVWRLHFWWQSFWVERGWWRSIMVVVACSLIVWNRGECRINHRNCILTGIICSDHLAPQPSVSAASEAQVTPSNCGLRSTGNTAQLDVLGILIWRRLRSVSGMF